MLFVNATEFGIGNREARRINGTELSNRVQSGVGSAQDGFLGAKAWDLRAPLLSQGSFWKAPAKSFGSGVIGKLQNRIRLGPWVTAFA